MKIEEVRQVIKKWYLIGDNRDIDILIAFVLAHNMPGDPVWLLYTGASSGLKTELFRAIEIPQIILHSDKITAHTLITGRKIPMKARRNVDLAPRLHNKIWMIYDFSQILTMKQETRNEVLSDMRSLYDGRLSKAFGTGQVVEYGTGTEEDPLIHCSLIAAVTHAIDRYLIEHRLLGTRYILYRIGEKPREEVLKKVDESFKKDDEARHQCNDTVRTYFQEFRERDTTISQESLEMIKKCANFVSIARTEVKLNEYTNEVEDIAAPEEPARVYKQFRKLFAAAMQLDDYDENKAGLLIKKVALSTIPRVRLKILELFAKGDSLNAYKIENELKIGKGYTRRNLLSLVHLGILDKTDMGDLGNDQGYGSSYQISQNDKTYQEVLMA